MEHASDECLTPPPPHPASPPRLPVNLVESDKGLAWDGSGQVGTEGHPVGLESEAAEALLEDLVVLIRCWGGGHKGNALGEHEAEVRPHHALGAGDA